MIEFRRHAKIVWFLATFLTAFSAAPRAEQPVTLFAAASTVNAVAAVARAYQAGGGGKVRTVFAASSTLARQIAQGAPADLYLSANAAWMDELEGRGAIEAGTRVDLLGNALVLIAPQRSPVEIDIVAGFALAGAPWAIWRAKVEEAANTVRTLPPPPAS